MSQLVEETSAKTKSVVGLDQANKADEELLKVKDELNALKEEVIKKPYQADTYCFWTFVKHTTLDLGLF